jgi:hypothetical protein
MHISASKAPPLAKCQRTRLPRLRFSFIVKRSRFPPRTHTEPLSAILAALFMDGGQTGAFRFHLKAAGGTHFDLSNAHMTVDALAGRWLRRSVTRCRDTDMNSKQHRRSLLRLPRSLDRAFWPFWVENELRMELVLTEVA